MSCSAARISTLARAPMPAFLRACIQQQQTTPPVISLAPVQPSALARSHTNANHAIHRRPQCTAHRVVYWRPKYYYAQAIDRRQAKPYLQQALNLSPEVAPLKEVIPKNAGHARVCEDVGIALAHFVTGEWPVSLRAARVMVVNKGLHVTHSITTMNNSLQGCIGYLWLSPYRHSA